MSIGLIVLFALVVLVLFGFAQRALDRLRLTDTQALVALGLIIVGSFFDIPVARAPVAVTVNAGGVLVPVALCVYLLVKADTAWERTRALLAALFTGGVVFGVSRWTDFGPHGDSVPMILDPLWLFSLIGGGIAYVLGRSRRAAFVAGVLGMVAFQAFDPFLFVAATSRPDRLALGGGGFFDAIILAGIVSVGLAEVVGETRERLQGGPDPRRAAALRTGVNRRDDGPEEEGGGLD